MEKKNFLNWLRNWIRPSCESRTILWGITVKSLLQIPVWTCHKKFDESFRKWTLFNFRFWEFWGCHNSTHIILQPLTCLIETLRRRAVCRFFLWFRIKNRLHKKHNWVKSGRRSQLDCTTLNIPGTGVALGPAATELHRMRRKHYYFSESFILTGGRMKNIFLAFIFEFAQCERVLIVM